MVNVIKMDMYRLFKSKAFKVILIVVALLNLSVGPLEKGLYLLGKYVVKSSDVSYSTTFKVASIIAKPTDIIDGILILLSVVWFSFADLGHGYIKNIAGQLPKKGHTVISKFVAIMVHNFFLFFVAAVFQVVGLIIFKTPNFSGFARGLGYFAVNWCLLMAISAIILFFSTGLSSKNAATVVAVLMGCKLLSLSYALIDMGIHQIPFKFLKKFSLSSYMPDALMGVKPPVVRSLVVSACFIIIIMRLTITIFNKKDVK